MRLSAGIFLILFSLAVATATRAADLPRIIFTVPDTVVESGQNRVWLNIYLDNLLDTIAGFQFVLQSTRPDLVQFDFNGPAFDTVGTLTSGFELALAHDSLPDHSTIKYQCIADLPFILGVVPGIAPQQAGIAVKIPIKTAPNPDTSQNLTSIIKIIKPFDFSDPNGVSIGTKVDTTYDTTYFLCLAWQTDSCLSWDSTSVNPGAYDSLRVDTLPYGYLDTTIVIKNEGSVTLWTPPPNCDFNLNSQIEITDLTCFVEFLFGTADPAICPNIYCDTDKDGATDISDLTYLVAYLFTDGPPPPE